MKTGTQEPRRGAPSAPPWDLLVASFLFLYFEFIILRWVPAYVRIVAYFSNLILISCTNRHIIGEAVVPLVQIQQGDGCRWR